MIACLMRIFLIEGMFDSFLSSLKACLMHFLHWRHVWCASFLIEGWFDAPFPHLWHIWCIFSSLMTYVMHIFLIVICDALFALTSVMHFFLIEGKFDALPDTWIFYPDCYVVYFKTQHVFFSLFMIHLIEYILCCSLHRYTSSISGQCTHFVAPTRIPTCACLTQAFLCGYLSSFRNLPVLSFSPNS